MEVWRWKKDLIYSMYYFASPNEVTTKKLLTVFYIYQKLY